MMSSFVRTSLATKLNSMIDVPILGEQQEQMAAELIIEKILAALGQNKGRDDIAASADAEMDSLAENSDASTEEGESSIKESMIKTINAKIDIPFANEEQEAMILSTVVDALFKEKFKKSDTDATEED